MAIMYLCDGLERVGKFTIAPGWLVVGLADRQQRADILMPSLFEMLRDESEGVCIAAADVVYYLRYNALKHRRALEAVVDSLHPECAKVVRRSIDDMMDLEKRLSEGDLTKELMRLPVHRVERK